jgi:hypothetical protein
VRRFIPTLVARSGTLGPRVLRPMEMTAQEIYSLMAAQEIYFAFESSAFRSPSAPWVRGACCGILLAAAVDLIVRFRAALARPGVDERSDFVPRLRLSSVDSHCIGFCQTRRVSRRRDDPGPGALFKVRVGRLPVTRRNRDTGPA